MTPGWLRRLEGGVVLATNAVESMISIARDHARNVKRWLDGKMAMRWCAAGMVEAKQQFRRINGHLHLATPRAALERRPPKLSDPSVMMRRPTQPDDQRAATEVPRSSGHPPTPPLTAILRSPTDIEVVKGLELTARHAYLHASKLGGTTDNLDLVPPVGTDPTSAA